MALQSKQSVVKEITKLELKLRGKFFQERGRTWFSSKLTRKQRADIEWRVAVHHRWFEMHLTAAEYKKLKAEYGCERKGCYVFVTAQLETVRVTIPAAKFSGKQTRENFQIDFIERDYMAKQVQRTRSNDMHNKVIKTDLKTFERDRETALKEFCVWHNLKIVKRYTTRTEYAVPKGNLLRGGDTNDRVLMACGCRLRYEYLKGWRFADKHAARHETNCADNEFNGYVW